MSHMTCHNHFIGSQTFDSSHSHFRVCIENCRVHILSLDMIGHGVTWQRILLHSHGIHIHMGLMNILSHGFT